MSAIFGVICFEERNTTTSTLETMGSALAPWGPDGVSLHFEGASGLGHAHRIDMPESRHETMPFTDEKSGLRFTAAARLDNRRELCDGLGLSYSQVERVTDSRLVCLAYLTWGDRSLERLRGDWAFAAWDVRSKRLFMARDTLGVTGLYYSHIPPCLFFSTSPSALLALPEIARKPDEPHLARLLAVLPEKSPDRSRTFWAGIRLLPPASYLSATRDSFRTGIFYHLENAPVCRYPSPSDYPERFLELFQRAVRVRLRSSRAIGTQLSGGLDSGSVTALAAGELAGSGQTLSAFTSVPLAGYRPETKRILSNEWDLAHDVDRCHGNITHMPVTAETLPPLDAVRLLLSFLGHPVHGAGNLFWMMSILEAARAKNIGVMLTGQAGNAGVSWTGGQNRIFFLWCEGRWDEGWKALKQSRRQRHMTLWQAVFTQLMLPAVRRAAGTALALSGAEFRKSIHVNAIHAGFARQSGLWEAMARESRGGIMKTDRIGILQRMATQGSTYQHLGAMYGLDIRDPTADQDLVEFCLGIPESLYTQGGSSRTLIRDAMKGILPESVRLNERRGRQAADLAVRLAAHAHDMNRELDDLEKHTGVTEVLDFCQVRRMWNAIRSNPRDPLHRLSSARLLRAVMAGRFISESQ